MIQQALHPLDLDFGVPFQYIPALWNVHFSSTGNGENVTAPESGVRFQPNNIPNAFATVQRYQAITFESCTHWMIAGRVFRDHPPDTAFIFGLWSDDNDPFGASRPNDGVYFEKASGLGELTYGRTIAGGTTGDPTEGLFEFEYLLLTLRLSLSDWNRLRSFIRLRAPRLGSWQR